MQIPSGSQITLYGAQSFAGGSGVSAAIVLVARTSPFGVLNFAQNVQVSNAGANGFVDGYVRKFGASLFVFPVGNNGFYGPFAAAADNTTGAYFHSNPSAASLNTTAKDVFVAAVSETEYWDINGTNPTKLTLTWENSSAIPSFADEMDQLTIVGWRNGKWELIPSVVDVTSILGRTSSLQTGSITTSNTLLPDRYEFYTFGTVSGSLPVTLSHFTARAESAAVVLDWRTTFETNSDHFVIERSGDGKGWQRIGEVVSGRESTERKDYSFVDPKPVSGTSLYRLKMVDADQSFTYSAVRSVFFDQFLENDLLYPNPTSSFLTIRSKHISLDRLSITVTDLSGRDRSHSVSQTDDQLDIQKLENGSYIFKFVDEEGHIIKTKIVVRK
ncbi:T9SS type A sorting domain-containing protein [Dyadobacter sp. CY347]|uniref:T9SS type A sorting domain-containing protein n=1 Tax=Dyadobacter sp. CY347 TaxID=2909336 RepID=UPI001F3FDCD9|nr:T9SS type A sorting domain-containing protein [Dyadobacter sp. CY347]MCF2490725.1 T9SS type A sorting domain-containing protein [Dyadobacter sp. CY347]